MKIYSTIISLLAIVYGIIPYISIIQAQPSNDECMDATIIDASSSNVTIRGNTTDAIPTNINGDIIPIVWYQDESMIDEIIVGTVCGADNNDTIVVVVYPIVTIVRGESCDSLHYDQLEMFTNYNEPTGCVTVTSTMIAK